jgi:hypothetical protein
VRDAPGVGGRKTRQIQPSSSLLYQGVLLQARVALFVRPLSLGLTLPLWTNNGQDKERSASLERRLRESSFYPSLTAARCTSSCAASAKAFLDLLAAPSAQR